MGKQKGISSTEVARIAGISIPRLHYWIRAVPLTPRNVGMGTGNHVEWTVLDLLAVRTISELRESQVSLQRIRKAIKAMGRRGIDWKDAILVAVDGDVFRVVSPSKAMELVTTGQLRLSFPVAEWHKEAKKEIQRLTA